MENELQQIEEYKFYRDQLRKAKIKGISSIAVSVAFLDGMLNEPEHLSLVRQAYESIRKAL